MLQLQAIHAFELDVGDLGVTVRRGDKWHRQALPGAILELVQQNDVDRSNANVVGYGEVLQSELMAFNYVRAIDIEREHEESSRCYSGLLASMRRAYGESFSETEPVTVLTYRRVS